MKMTDAVGGETGRQWEKILETAARNVRNKLDADVIVVNAAFRSDLDVDFLSSIRQYKKRNGLFLVLVTNGGEIGMAYRIAQHAREHYYKFTIFVSGSCKSAGTLCALGANEVVMGEMGELGPLDVQLGKKDDLERSSSSLALDSALQTLCKKSIEVFQSHMTEILNYGRGQISLQLAIETATKMTIGLFEPIYRQIDPITLGDTYRDMAITKYYGRLLLSQSPWRANFDDDALTQLVDGYPDHGFIIDYKEAKHKKLFKNVRQPSEEEKMLADVLNDYGRVPISDPDRRILDFLNYKYFNEFDFDEEGNVYEVDDKYDPDKVDEEDGCGDPSSTNRNRDDNDAGAGLGVDPKGFDRVNDTSYMDLEGVHNATGSEHEGADADND